jgi:hypothetical protein
MIHKEGKRGRGLPGLDFGAKVIFLLFPRPFLPHKSPVRWVGFFAFQKKIFFLLQKEKNKDLNLGLKSI